MNRRSFLRFAALSGAALSMPVLVACGEDDSSSTSEAAATPTRSPRSVSKGELRLADNLMLTSVDPDLAPFQWTAYGVTESLMRITAGLEIVPNLAKSLTRKDSLTWEVVLDEGLTFHDGSAVDAAAVIQSFDRSFEKRPSTRGFLPVGTELVPAGLSLTIKTPSPVGLMPNFLAAPDLAIKKVTQSGGFVYTGPFTIADFAERNSATLKAYPKYRGGPARLETVRIREVVDVNTRLLALQSGEVDMAQAMLPSNVPLMRSSGLDTYSFAFSRQNIVILNLKREPFDDIAVRKAFALVVDRDALIKGVMEGAATPAYALGPDQVGIQGLLNTQKYDKAEAQRVLDAAGWKVSAGGLREKAGKNLSFKLGFYTQRAELEALAIVIKDQLRAIGIEATLDRIADINSAVSNNEFDATLYSYSTIPYGDISRALESLYLPSGSNKDRYTNERVIALHKQYIQESDPAKRRPIFESIQTAIGEDTPIVHVLNPQQIVGTSKKVKDYIPHPIENYKLDADLRIEA